MRCVAIRLWCRKHRARPGGARSTSPAPAIAAALSIVGALSAGGAGATFLAAGAALAAPAADCGAHSGVLVVVDFSHWGGHLVRGCAPGSAAGLDGMHQAGFVTAGDQSDGTAFVCRIGLAASGPSSERPTPAEDACIVTPPADAYWSFWYADTGHDSWSYSTEGVDTFRPPVGSVEAWEFGSGRPPPATPSQLRTARSGSPAGKSGGLSVAAAPSARSLASVRSGGGSADGSVAAALAVVAVGALAATVARRRQRVGRQ